ncbi:ABM domain-containing protein [Balamuthia mandrillaris]
MSDAQPQQKHTLQSLLAAPKGNLAFTPGTAFMLHVFWEAPSMEAAQELLAGLKQCARATHRDTPCVPTYLFRISTNDADKCAPAPNTMNDHPHIRSALKKLQVGVPLPAVRAELLKRRIDPDFVAAFSSDISLDAELPQQLQTSPVRVEFTEVYLDERAFMEHAGSRDYLDGHATVMNPALHYSVPVTIRMGNPTTYLVEGILEPVLNENVAPLIEGCSVWQPVKHGANVSAASFLSVDVDSCSPEEAMTRLQPSGIRDYCTTIVAFSHPLRPSTSRIMCVLPSLPPQPVLDGFANELRPARGEVHMNGDEDTVESARKALASSGLEFVFVNAGMSVGYVLHERVADVHETKQINWQPMLFLAPAEKGIHDRGSHLLSKHTANGLAFPCHVFGNSKDWTVKSVCPSACPLVLTIGP